MKLKLILLLSYFLSIASISFAVDYKIVANGNEVSDGDLIEDCTGLAVSYEISPTTGIDSYAWDLGNSTTSTKADPGTIYDKVGSYSVSVILYLSDGSTQTISASNLIEVKEKPDVELVLSKSSVCKDEVVTFSHTEALGTYGSIKYIINGTTYAPNSGEYFEYTASQIGTFDVVLDVSLPTGCSNQSRQTLVVKEDFTVDFTSGGSTVSKFITCDNSKELSFTAETSRVLDNPIYEWSINGSLIPNSDTQTFTYTFTNSPDSEYEVEVGVYDGDCYKVSATKTVIEFIDFDDAFTVSQLSEDCNSIRYRFTPKANLLGESGNFRWDFGNGTQNVSTLNSRTRTYTKGASAQNITVSLTNRDDNTCSFSETVTIPEENTGAFVLDENSFCTIPATTTVTSLNPVPDGDYEWNVIGDTQSNYPNTPNPTFTFSNYGNYTIQLLGDGGCLLHEESILVTELDISIDLSNAFACINDESSTTNVQFDAIVNGTGNYAYSWVVRDTYRGTTANVGTAQSENTNLTWGSYEIDLTVRDIDNDCENTVTEEFEVRVRPTVAIGLDKTEICNGETVTGTPTVDNFGTAYNNFLTAKGETILFAWDFNGDGNFGDANPYTYQNYPPTTIDVGLSAWYSSGVNCSAVPVTEELEIKAPQAIFSISALDICDPTLLEVTNNSDEGVEVGNIQYDWTFVITEIDGTVTNYTYQTFDVNQDPLVNLNIGALSTGRIPEGAQVDITLDASLASTGCSDTYSESTTMLITPELRNIVDHETTCLNVGLDYTSELYDPSTVMTSIEWRYTHSDGTIFSLTGEDVNFNPTKLGEYDVEVILSYASCPQIVYTLNDLMVKGIDFQIDGLSSFCHDEIPTNDSISIIVNDIFPADSTFEYTWTSNDATFTGVGKSDSLTKIAYSDLDLRVFTDQSTRNQIDLQLRLIEGTDTLCADQGNHEILLTNPEPLDFDITHSAYNIQYQYRCRADTIQVRTRIDHRLNDGAGANERVLEDYSIEWEYMMSGDPLGTGYESITPVNGGNRDTRSIFILPSGIFDMKMIITDANGCKDSLEFEVESPEIIQAVSNFEQDKVLTCPGVLTLIDSDSNTDYSTPSMFVFSNGDTLKSQIIERAWDFGDGTTAPDPSANLTEIEHFFESSGDDSYDVTLTITEEFPDGNTSCETISAPKEVKIEGVRGSFDVDRRVIHKGETVYFTSELEDLFKSSAVTYNWASGDGNLSGYGDYEEMMFTYDTERDSVYVPALLLESSGCISEASTDVTIKVLPCPEIPITDTTFCVSDDINTISALDTSYNSYLNIDVDGNTLVSEVHYEWLIDGNVVNSDQETISFEDGRDSNPLTIDPDNADGIELTVRVWVSSLYNGTVQTDTVCLSERTINIKYEHSPYPKFDTLETCTFLSLESQAYNYNYLDEKFATDADYEWLINTVNGGDLTSTDPVYDSLIELEVQSFDAGSVQIDVDLSLTTSSNQSLTCPQTVDTLFSIYRKPLITLVDSVEGCEGETLTISPSAEEITDKYIWSWREISSDGGSLDTASISFGEIEFTEGLYDADRYRIVSTWELTVKNSYSTTCHSLDTVTVIFNQNPELIFEELENCTEWSGKYYAENFEGFVSFEWDDPLSGAVTGGTLSSFDSLQTNDSTFLSLVPASFTGTNVFMDVPLHLHTKLTSESGYECGVDTDTSIRFYREPLISMVDTVEGCEGEALQVLPDAEGVTTDYEWSWREISSDGGSVNVVESDFGAIEFTEGLYDANRYRIVSTWELTVKNSYSTACYSLDTVTVIFNQNPELFFDELENCTEWAGKYYAENFEGSVSFEWDDPLLGAVSGGTLSSFDSLQSNDSTFLSLVPASFTGTNVFMDVPLHLHTKLTSESGYECGVDTDTSIRFYREPLISMVDTVEGCEGEVLQVLPDAEGVTADYEWSWREIETTGGDVNTVVSDFGAIEFTEGLYEADLYRIVSTWELTVKNSYSTTCHSLDTVTVIFNQNPELVFEELENCTEWAGKYYAENFEGFVSFEWDDPLSGAVTGGTISSFDSMQTNDSTFLSLVPASFTDTNVFMDVALHLHTKLTSESGYECGVDTDTSIRFYREPLISMVDTVEGCEGETLQVLPDAEGVTTDYEWYWREISSDGGNVNTVISDFGEIEFTEGLYDADRYRIVSNWELIVKNSYSTVCYSLDTVTVIFNQNPELVFEELENCTEWSGKYYAENFEGFVSFEWDDPLLGAVTGGTLSSFDSMQMNDSTFLSLVPASFTGTNVFMDVPLHLHTKLISESGYECGVDTDTSIRFYREPLISMVDTVEGCEGEALQVLPDAEGVTADYEWSWREISSDGGNVNVVESDFGAIEFTESLYDIDRYRIVSTWELTVKNSYSTACYSLDTVTVIFNQNPELVFEELENCREWAGKYYAENFEGFVSFEWDDPLLGAVTGGTLSSFDSLQTNDSTFLSLVPASFTDTNVFMDVPLHLHTKLTSESGYECGVDTDTSIRFYREPLISMVDTVEGCEGEVLQVLPNAESVTTDYEWSWREISSDGGNVNTVISDFGTIEFTEGLYDADRYRIVSTWELTVKNSYSTACYSLDTVTVIFNQNPELVFEELENCTEWAGKYYAENFEGSVSFEWDDPLLGAVTGGTLSSFDSLQSNDSTFLSLVPASFTGTNVFMDVPLHLHTKLTSESGYECGVDTDTSIRFYREPLISMVDTVEGCEGEVLQVLPDAEGVTADYEWTWREISSEGGSVNVVESDFGAIEFTEDLYDADRYRIVSTWELTVKNSYSTACYSLDTVTVIFNQKPELVFEELENCTEWAGKYYAENFEGFVSFEWDDPLLGAVSGGTLSSFDSLQTNDSTFLSLVPASFTGTNVFMDVPLHLHTKLTSESGYECGVDTDTSIRFYREPIISMVDTVEGCEGEVLQVLPDAEGVTTDYEWSWREIETTGGDVVPTINTFGSIRFSSKSFDDSVYTTNSKWELTVTNKYSKDCYSIDTVNIIFNKIPTAQIEFSRNPICIGETLELSVDESDAPNTGVIYHWDIDGDGEYDLASKGDTTVVYTSEGIREINMYIETSYGCPSPVITKEIEVKPLPVADFTVENVCIGDASNFLNSSSIADDSDLSYKWYFSSDSEGIDSEDMNPTFTYSAPGDYNVKLIVESPYGCLDSVEFTTTIHPLPEMTVSEDVYICYGEAIEISAQNAHEYLWSSEDTTSNIIVSPLENTTYFVTGYSIYGCQILDSVNVFVIPPIADSDSIKEACEGDIITLNAEIEDYDSISQFFDWSTGETTSEIDVNRNGKYSVITHVEHESGKECDFTIEFEAVFHKNPSESFEDEIVHCFEDGPIVLQATQGDNFTYYWEDTGETSRTVNRYSPNTYKVIMIDESHETLCETVEEFTVFGICDPRSVAPNAFTPNNDGLNDKFYVKLAYALNIEISIYNRWGEIVFNGKYPTVDESNLEENGWDGTYKGKPSEPGVYYYTLRYESELERGTYIEKTGSLTLIK
ncbi:PKD domain-containing protein [Sediminitomix flava]|uniref:Gliding motility-associated-like protein n=1 Tax=Sediminitomix flava TaxID=379075 RepID=A0A315ZC58_SEDFL|nr:PKD domain-containing protein [Sediminitomix flava]PWJ42324.1 gliding motility-associated-like protein [Sediminitomix flava]